MKFLGFKTKSEKEKLGLFDGEKITELNGNLFNHYKTTKNYFDLEEITFLPPCKPSKLIAVGLNYLDHAIEMKKTPPEDPMLFLKPSTAVIGHKDNIVYPSHMSERVDYEGELAIVMGKTAKMLNEDETMNYVFGYTCINDVTARDLQAKDIQFTRGKGFDTFAPIGPFIETDIDPTNLTISTYLNGERKQHSNTKNLIFKIPKLISFISQVMTLYPGDIIATGTPSGINPMKKGDKVEVEIEGIGKLTNFVL